MGLIKWLFGKLAGAQEQENLAHEHKKGEHHGPSAQERAASLTLPKSIDQSIRIIERNVSFNWIETGEWRSWEPPLNIVRGESFRQKNLQKFAGIPRSNGYLIPVCVSLVREPDNEHDPNAVRVEIEGVHVGYIARELAQILSQILDAIGMSSYDVAGLIRGGSLKAPSLGVHIWPGRLLSRGPILTNSRRIRYILDEYISPWPPHSKEGVPVNDEYATICSMEFPPRRPSEKPGYYQGKHYTEWVETVKQLKRINEYEKAEKLLLALLEAVESESKAKDWGVAPWYYEQLAIIYRKQKALDKELQVLERFAQQKIGPGTKPPQLLERLEKVRRMIANSN